LGIGPGTGTNAVVAHNDCDWAGSPSREEWLLKNKTGAPVWPVGLPEESADEGLLKGEPVWPFRPDGDEI
jgi:hypothetical protein